MNSVMSKRGAVLKRAFAIAMIVTALLSATVTLQTYSAKAQTQAINYQLTVRNITDRQPISPPIVVIHDSNAVLLPSSAERLSGLEEFAESGSKPALMESLRNRTGVKDVVEFGGIIQPQSQQTIFSNLTAEPGDHISVLGMLTCTNDGLAFGTAIITDANTPAFGSGVAYDAGTENNDESRRTVPCLEGAGVSNLNTADGEGTIEPHPGIAVTGDLGAVFGWERTVMEFVVDRRGATPKRAFEVGATLKNNTIAQPITPPVVVVHDKNVDVISYRRPVELPGIDRLSESGDGAKLLDTLAATPGVVSVTQWETGGPIAPGRSFSGNARAFVGTNVTILGMFACTNDGYILASAEVTGSSIEIRRTSVIATVFDSGAENNDETAATVPCLGGAEAAFSDGPGENDRREHPGIRGDADLAPNVHGWTAEKTATMSLHARVTPTPEPTDTPTATPEPTAVPTTQPTEVPTTQPNAEPSPGATVQPEPTEPPEPTAVPTTQPTVNPTTQPTVNPTTQPTAEPSPGATVQPEPAATMEPEELPDTGGSSLNATWWGIALILGLSSAFAALWFLRLPNRRDV